MTQIAHQRWRCFESSLVQLREGLPHMLDVLVLLTWNTATALQVGLGEEDQLAAARSQLFHTTSQPSDVRVYQADGQT